jgi:hypothetical protein
VQPSFQNRRRGRLTKVPVHISIWSLLVDLDPLVAAPIRDVNNVAVMQTALVGDFDILCTKDHDFFAAPANNYLKKVGILVLDDVRLTRQLRS